MPTDEPKEHRKKRAKIVSACSECRRKKTKCDGVSPCKTCTKAQVSCIYPSQSDDKRNSTSKVAMEAIEERVKAIEDLLQVFLQSQIAIADLDPVAVSSFLERDKMSSPSSSSSLARSPISSHGSPIHTTSNPFPAQQELRLPSIHNLSVPYLPAKHEVRDLPPLGFQNYYPSYASRNENPPPCRTEEEYALQPIKKRRRGQP